MDGGGATVPVSVTVGSEAWGRRALETGGVGGGGEVVGGGGVVGASGRGDNTHAHTCTRMTKQYTTQSHSHTRNRHI